MSLKLKFKVKMNTEKMYLSVYEGVKSVLRSDVGEEELSKLLRSLMFDVEVEVKSKGRPRKKEKELEVDEVVDLFERLVEESVEEGVGVGVEVEKKEAKEDGRR